MAAVNLDDVRNQLRDGGLIVDALEIGRVIRCKIEGDGEKRGWYALHELLTHNGDLLLVGSFGVWQGNDNGAQKIQLHKTELTVEQRDSIRRRLAEDRKRADRARAQEAERAARRASAAWAKCSPSGDADYLARKGVGAHGVRFSPSGAIVIPLLDTAGQIHGLQAIRTKAQAKGAPDKQFWPAGVVKKGHFHLMGTPTWIALIAEGYATGASLHEATGLPVAIAFDAGNLAAVAVALHKRYKTARILICADDDALQKCRVCKARLLLADHPHTCPSCGEAHNASNAGIVAASTAALEVGGAWIAPAFADEAARRAAFIDQGRKLTDFNDLHQAAGLHVVRTQLEARITELGWRVGQRAAASTQTGGRGAALAPIATLEELLERYALVYGKNGLAFDRQEHMLLTLQDIGHACGNRGQYRAWGEHPDRAIVREREVGFDPGGDDPAVTCNLWGGWPTTPAAGDCEILIELLRFLCSKDARSHALFEWVLRWCAWPVQHPGAKMKTALVFHGPSGAGKNRFFEALMAVYGEYGALIDQNAIDDKFTDWAERKLFLLADEVVARKELYYVKNKLKALITGEWIRINPKTIAAHNERNHANIVFLSNESQPVIVERDDRRYCVVWTQEKYTALPSGGLADDGFYRRLRDAARDPAVIAAFHEHLLRVDMGDFDEGTLPPFSDAKLELIGLSLDSPSGFYYALKRGDIHGIPCCPALSTDVYECYRLWCARVGERALPQIRFINVLSRQHHVDNQRRRYNDEANVTKGPHGVLSLGDEEPSPGDDVRSWLGARIYRFKDALKDMRGGLFHD